MKNVVYNTDLCVIGGGLSGLCTALAAARHGIKTVLVHDRAVLGGNASEEIRMHVCGARGKDNRETGILEEILMDNYYCNKGLKYSVWSSVLYGKAIAEPNLTLLLDSSCMDAAMDGDRIVSIKAWQSNAETYHTVNAKYFADCSGDSILSTLTGAEFMYGREAKSDFGETIPPDTADKKTMGMSCLFQIRETDKKVDFVPPEWAYKYTSDDQLPYKDHDLNSNFWWIEIGGMDDCIHDTSKCRDELLKICFGVWDHIKNYGDHGADNWELEWIGFLPGKRESRRYVGKYIVTQNDVEAGGNFADTVAYAGWTMDDHFPEGFYYTAGHPTIYHPAPSPWGLPLRSMISENIQNLVFAGRNISVTHAALSSTRVMATCAMLGQALGTAVAMAVEDSCAVENVSIQKLQQTLMHDDCYIPGASRNVAPLGYCEKCSSDIVRNGIDRGDDNLWIGNKGDFVEYEFEYGRKINEIRLVFDSDLNRDYNNMPYRFALNEKRYVLPKTLIKEYRVEIEDMNGKTHCIDVKDNHRRLVVHNVDYTARRVRFVPSATHGCDEFRLFDFEIN